MFELFQLFIIAAEASPGSGSTNSVVFVAIVGGIATVIGAYFAYKGNRRQADNQQANTDRTSILDERKQISDEWKTLREYKDLQLVAARKENEALVAQIRTLEAELDAHTALINQLVMTLNRTGLANLIPSALQARVDANNQQQTNRDEQNAAQDLKNQR